jgi:hypothetical protein
MKLEQTRPKLTTNIDTNEPVNKGVCAAKARAQESRKTSGGGSCQWLICSGAMKTGCGLQGTRRS